MTICPSKRSPTGRSRCCCAARPDARPIPGDVFYLHSRLLERSARVNEEYVEKVTKGASRADRLAHRAADHRDPGRRRDRIRAHQRDLDHRRADLPRDRPVQRRHPSRRSTPASRYRASAAPRRPTSSRSSAAASAWRWRSTASWRRSRSSPPTSTRPPAGSSSAAQRVTEVMKQKQYAPMSVAEMALSHVRGRTTATWTRWSRRKIVEFEAALQASRATSYSRAAEEHQCEADADQGKRSGAQEVLRGVLLDTGDAHGVRAPSSEQRLCQAPRKSAARSRASRTRRRSPRPWRWSRRARCAARRSACGRRARTPRRSRNDRRPPAPGEPGLSSIPSAGAARRVPSASS